MSLFEEFRTEVIQKNLIKPQDAILIGISGGPDSVCLFHFLRQFSLECPIKIGLAHVHYGLRPYESIAEMHGLQSLAHYYNVSLYQKVLCLLPGANLQERAREIRFSFFKHIIKEHHYNKLALAHHKNDQVETFFIRLFRGSSLFGLLGMQRQSYYQGISIIRPLLTLSKKQLQAHLDSNKHSYWIDSSNTKVNYLRNWIRHICLPSIKEKVPSIETYCLRSIQHLNDSAEWIEKCLKERLKHIIVYQDKQEVQLDLHQWNKEDMFVRKSLLVRLARKVGHRWNYFDDHQLIELNERLKLFKGNGSQYLFSKYDVELVVEYNNFSLLKKCDTQYDGVKKIFYPALLNTKQKMTLHDRSHLYVTKQSSDLDTDDKVLVLDEASLSSEFIIRSPKKADKVCIQPKIGIQSLKALLINWKIPKRFRHHDAYLIEHQNTVIGVIIRRPWKVHIHPDYVSKKHESRVIYLGFA